MAITIQEMKKQLINLLKDTKALKNFIPHQLLKNYAEQNQMEYLDYFSIMTDGKNGMQKQLTNDGVHVTKEGYQIMINMVNAAISKVLN